jgi:hypothetical protein
VSFWRTSEGRKALIEEREKALDTLRRYLKDLPGVKTPWLDIGEQMSRVTTKTLAALAYRVEVLSTNSFDEG